MISLEILISFKAIVHGDAPTLPETGYSEEAHAFIRACLDKNPNNRPSYSMLLRHPWLSSLMQPPTEANGEDALNGSVKEATEDEEVAAWVKEKLDRRERGLLQEANKPALHAVALDAVPGSPLLDDPSAISAQC